MIMHSEIEKETKIYIPKVTNPQILTYRSVDSKIKSEQGNTVNSVINTECEKRR